MTAREIGSTEHLSAPFSCLCAAGHRARCWPKTWYLGAHRFVVRVRTAPDGRTGLRVSQLELESYAGRHTVPGDLPEVIQTAAEDIVAAGVTAQGVDVLVALRLL